MYSISDLERFSGIKAHTLRIWEKRYQLFEPARTEGNHRQYSDLDVLKLLKVEQLLKQGNRISKIAELTIREMETLLRELLNNKASKEESTEYYINLMVESAIQFDEQQFCQLYDELRDGRCFLKIWEEYLVPALQQMGKLWLLEDIEPAEEHFFSQIVRRKIQAEVDKLSLVEKNQSPILLFLPPNEHHEMGLLVAEYILRKKGIYTLNFGADTPVNNLLQMKKVHNSSIFISFINGLKMDRAFVNFIRSLNGENNTVLLSGNIHLEDRKKIKNMPHIVHFKSIDRFQSYISQMKR